MFYRRLKPKAFMRSSPVPLIDWALRKYGAGEGEIGQEADPAEYIAALVDVFRGVRRVLRGDGVALVNLGDSYAQDTKWGGASGNKNYTSAAGGISRERRTTGAKDKDLLMLPFRVALALQADGWWVRSVITWLKFNAMPESVADRPTTAHEYWFMLAKQPRYHWDGEAVRQRGTDYTPHTNGRDRNVGGRSDGFTRPRGNVPTPEAGRNFRTSDPWKMSLDLAIEETRARLAHLEAIKARGGLLVDEDDAPLALSVTTAGYAGAHYATFPPKLIEPLLLASVPRECCSVCGAAWVRQTRPSEQYEAALQAARGKGDWYTRSDTTVKSNPCDQRVAAEYITTGFAPSCSHADAPTVPGAVLDPFAGSGTVGQVALKHGRRAVLIELSETYLDEHVSKRTNGVQIDMSDLLF